MSSNPGTSALVLALGSLATIWLSVLAFKRPDITLRLYLVAVVLQFSPFMWNRLASIGRFDVGLPQFFMIPMCLALLLGLSRMANHVRVTGDSEAESLQRLLGSLLAIISVVVLAGMLVAGLTATATYGAGTWLGLAEGIVLAWYVASFAATTGEGIWRIVKFGGVAAAIVAVAVIALWGLGDSTSSIDISGTITSGRPLVSTTALLLLWGAVSAVFAVDSPRTRDYLLSLLLLSIVLLSQVRSVWLAAIAVALVGGRWLATRLAASPQRTMLTIFGLLALTISAASGRISSIPVFVSLAESAANDQTWQWRVQRWFDYLDLDRSVSEWAFGAIGGPTASVDGIRFADPSHNMLVTSLNLTGLLGVSAVIGLVVCAILVAKRHRRATDYPVAACLITSLIVFSVAYDWPAWSWLLFGYLLGWKGAGAETNGQRLSEGHTLVEVQVRSRTDAALNVLPQTNGVLAAPSGRRSWTA